LILYVSKLRLDYLSTTLPALTSEEIERRRALISKLKEETINQHEAQELISLLEKEKCIALQEQSDCMLVFAILSLISYVNEYLSSHSEIISKEEENNS
jgi:hypothetical protein